MTKIFGDGDSTMVCPLVTTVVEWLTWAKKSHSLKDRTREGYAYCMSLLVKAGFLKVEDLVPARVAAFLDERLAQGFDTGTLNRNLAAVCSLGKYLLARERFPKERLDSLRALRLREPPPETPFFLTPENAAILVKAARRVDNSWRVAGKCLERAVVLAIASGVRASELVALHHEDTYLRRPRLEDEPFLLVRRNARKTYKSHRPVPITRADAARLLELGVGDGRKGPIFPPEKRNSGEPYLRANTLGRRLALARAVAEITGGVVDFLTLRHTFASWHVQSGRSIAKVAKWLGNSVRVCERHYATLAHGGDVDVEASAELYFERYGALAADTSETAKTQPGASFSELETPKMPERERGA